MCLPGFGRLSSLESMRRHLPHFPPSCPSATSPRFGARSWSTAPTERPHDALERPSGRARHIAGGPLKADEGFQLPRKRQRGQLPPRFSFGFRDRVTLHETASISPISHSATHAYNVAALCILALLQRCAGCCSQISLQNNIPVALDADFSCPWLSAPALKAMTPRGGRTFPLSASGPHKWRGDRI